MIEYLCAYNHIWRGWGRKMRVEEKVKEKSLEFVTRNTRGGVVKSIDKRKYPK